jgi:hypothetical protein
VCLQTHGCHGNTMVCICSVPSDIEFLLYSWIKADKLKYLVYKKHHGLLLISLINLMHDGVLFSLVKAQRVSFKTTPASIPGASRPPPPTQSAVCLGGGGRGKVLIRSTQDALEDASHACPKPNTKSSSTLQSLKFRWRLVDLILITVCFKHM